MKQTTIKKLAFAAVLLTFAAGARAQISIQPVGTLKVEGDSTLHKWSTSTSSVTMTFVLADGAPQSLADAIKASKIKTLDVTIAVAGLKSGESGLDKNMRKAMNEEKYPNVEYRLDSYEVKKGANEDVVNAKAVGQLTIAGQTKPVTIDVEFRLGPDGAAVKGSYTLVMSDYGIKPPTLMLGTIKVRDPVTIRFDFLLKPQDAAKKGGS
jgi:polyisoprenoid-binding protein YceI